MTYQLWFGNVMLGQWSEPELTQPLIDYIGRSLDLQFEIGPRKMDRALFDWKFDTLECHYLIKARLGYHL